MKIRHSKLSSRLLRNYIVVFLITTLITFAVIALLGAVNSMNRADSLYSRLSAVSLMQDDYLRIPTAEVEANGGSLQVVIAEALPATETEAEAATATSTSEIRYRIVHSAGAGPFSAAVLPPGEFTRFLSESGTARDHITVEYNEEQRFWLIVSLPMQVRIMAGLSLNFNSPVQDQTLQMLGLVGVGYLLILLLSALLYARIAASSLTRPLAKLGEAAMQMKEGRYSVRAEDSPIREIHELAQAFNQMAGEMERQTQLAEQSEQNRRSLLLDLSHDLKNPLATIMGYSEHLLDTRPPQHLHDHASDYVQIIHDNAKRASGLVADLSELSALTSPSFRLERETSDWCEFVRQQIIGMLPELTAAGLQAELALPEEELLLFFDPKQMSRVLFNLLHNAAVHAEEGSVLAINLERTADSALFTLENNCRASEQQSTAVPPQAATKPAEPPPSFVGGRTAASLNPAGVGLGLAIVERIATAHGGELELAATAGRFAIRLRLPLSSGQPPTNKSKVLSPPS